jgi:hypothetical protein
MSKPHTVTLADFSHHLISDTLAASDIEYQGDQTMKQLRVFIWANDPTNFHYEVVIKAHGYEKYATLAEAIRRYNEL